MATDFAQLNAASASPPVGAVPFLLGEKPLSPDLAVALEAAALAEKVSLGERRNMRCRLSYLLCEVANQLRQQTGSFDPDGELPLSRYDLAEVLGVSLCKVKRVLALLCLSGVVTTDGKAIQVLSWRRLCLVAQVDPSRLGLNQEDEDETVVVPLFAREKREQNLLTSNGEPACFI